MEAWSRRAGVLRLEKTTTDAVSSDVLNSLFPLKKKQDDKSLSIQGGRGSEEPGGGRVSKKRPGCKWQR